MQAPRRSGLPHRRSLAPRRPRKVHPHRPPLNAAPLVGAPPARILPRYAARPAAARSRRPQLPARVQAQRPPSPPRPPKPPAIVGQTHPRRRGPPPRPARLHSRLRQLAKQRQARLPNRIPRASPRRPPQRNAPGRRPIRGRRIHTAGGAAAGLRRIRKRPQPRRLPHTQNYAGRHPPQWGPTRRRTAPSRRPNQGASRTRTRRPISAGRRRRCPHRIPVGANHPLRITQLRRRNPTDALYVAVQQNQPQARPAPNHNPQPGRNAPRGLRDIHAARQQRSRRRHGQPRQGYLPLLPHNPATAPRARPTSRTARRRGRHIRRQRQPNWRRAHHRRGYPQARREGPPLSLANPRRLRRRPQSASPRSRPARRLGTRRQARALPRAG